MGQELEVVVLVTHEMVDGHVAGLAMAVEAPIALLELGGVPGAVVVEKVAGSALEVQSGSLPAGHPLKRPMFKELRTAVFEVWQSASMAA